MVLQVTLQHHSSSTRVEVVPPPYMNWVHSTVFITHLVRLKYV